MEPLLRYFFNGLCGPLVFNVHHFHFFPPRPRNCTMIRTKWRFWDCKTIRLMFYPENVLLFLCLICFGGVFFSLNVFVFISSEAYDATVPEMNLIYQDDFLNHIFFNKCGFMRAGSAFTSTICWCSTRHFWSGHTGRRVGRRDTSYPHLEQLTVQPHNDTGAAISWFIFIGLNGVCMHTQGLKWPQGENSKQGDSSYKLSSWPETSVVVVLLVIFVSVFFIL